MDSLCNTCSNDTENPRCKKEWIRNGGIIETCSDYTKISERLALNKKFKSVVDSFMKENGLNCADCRKFINGKCNSPVYCIVNGSGLYVSFERKNKE